LDVRQKPQPIDLDFITWAGTGELPIALILTKADKLKSNELARSVKLYEDTLLKMWEELPPMFLTSAEKKVGRDEVLNFMDTAMKSRG
ncbi:MAG TPA: YihA family ribosome biogenesis GTP-binding protein, partial [Cyclobacteriaceae bacterium]|nr:YihA family ribosome biogenesis GTP-binding protein [Cyclobacteriaceae bacterium]